jgi:hypothetical protein
MSTISVSTESAEVRRQFRAGQAPFERKLALAAGSLPLEAADRAELLTLLAADEDERIAERAQNALLSTPLSAFLAALARPDAAPQLFQYCGRQLADQPAIAEAMAAHPSCAAELVPIVGRLSVAAVQALMDDLGRLSAHPALAAALLHVATVTPDQREQLQELSLGEAGERALAEAVQDAVPEPKQSQSLLLRLARLNVLERVQLALRGGREERLALIRDPCKVVQRAVLQSAKLTEREVENFAAMSSLTEEILRIISQKRSFRKSYQITRNLANNPKTPLDVSLHLLQLLQTNDLKSMSTNKNIPDTLRQAALKLFRERSASRKG